MFGVIVLLRAGESNDGASVQPRASPTAHSLPPDWTKANRATPTRQSRVFTCGGGQADLLQASY